MLFMHKVGMKQLKKNYQTWRTTRLENILNCYEIERKLNQNEYSKSNTISMAL